VFTGANSQNALSDLRAGSSNVLCLKSMFCLQSRMQEVHFQESLHSLQVWASHTGEFLTGSQRGPPFNLVS
jgi:hypothetical protein